MAKKTINQQGLHSQQTISWNLKASKCILTTVLIALLISICIAPVMAADPISKLPTVHGDYYLECDIEITETWDVPSGDTTLDLRGHSITLIGSGSVINVGGGDNLTITDTLALTDTSVAEGKITGGSNGAGGGVSVGGGGLFTLAGGNITGNTATKQGGGGVSISGSGFIMTGGNITYNTAKITGDVPSPSYDASGGGVCVIDQGSFIMTGGNIMGNTAEENRCGGVSVIGHGLFTISGNAKIEGNMAGDVPNNVRLLPGKVITLGILTDGAHIGVTPDMSKGTPVHIAEREDGKVTATDAAYFFADAGQPYSIKANDDGTYLDLVHGTDGLKPWTEKNSLPTTPGEYYLKEDVTINSMWVVPFDGATTIDLNGHFIKLAEEGNGGVIWVSKGVSLTITDSSGGNGQITGGNGDSGVYVYEGNFTLVGGTITGNTAEFGAGVCVDNGSFTMYGGTITGNTATRLSGGCGGGGVHIRQQGNFTMYGGTITGNTADASPENNYMYGGGVGISNGSITLSGNVKIEGNTQNGVINNVQLSDGNIITLGDLTEGAHIGITTASLPTKINSIHIAERVGETVTATDAAYFFADNEAYSIRVNDEGAYLEIVCGKPWIKTDSLPTTHGEYYLENDITILSTWDVPSGDTTINLRGHSITLSGYGSVINVGGHDNLTITDTLALTDPSVAEGKITGGSNEAGGGVSVGGGGLFTLAGGNITGNTATKYGGGGVGISASGFIMTGGNITYNTAKITGDVPEPDYYASGGGVCIIDQGSFTMTGGNIMGNTAEENGCGGVSILGDGLFTISGNATINANNDLCLASSSEVIHVIGPEFNGSVLNITGDNITIGSTIVQIDPDIPARDIVKKFKLYDENFVLKVNEDENTLVVADAKILKPVIPEIEKDGEFIFVPKTAENATIDQIENNVIITDNASGVVLEIEFTGISDEDGKFKGVPENIVAYYPESPMIPSDKITEHDGKPGNAKYSLNLTLENVTTLLPTINATVNTTVKDKFANEGKELMAMFTAESNTEEINKNLSKLEVVMIFKKSWYDTMNKGVCWYHRADNGTILKEKQISLADVQSFTGEDGETYYRVTITVDTPPFFSDYGLYGMRGPEPSPSPSHGGNSGSSTWATVTQTVTPTSIGNETDTPTSTPTDKISETVPTGTQPTGTKTPMPMLGVLVGLGLAGLVLRRK